MKLSGVKRVLCGGAKGWSRFEGMEMEGGVETELEV